MLVFEFCGFNSFIAKKNLHEKTVSVVAFCGIGIAVLPERGIVN
jgi:hypothetical protein